MYNLYTTNIKMFLFCRQERHVVRKIKENLGNKDAVLHLMNGNQQYAEALSRLVTNYLAQNR